MMNKYLLIFCIIGLCVSNGIAMDFHRYSLHIAAAKGNVEEVNQLIANNAYVNQPGDGGGTPLHLAALCGHESVVKILLDHGANVYKKDRCGDTPQKLAEKSGHKAIIQLLSDCPANSRLVKRPMSLTYSLHKAVIKGNTKKVIELITKHCLVYPENPRPVGVVRDKLLCNFIDSLLNLEL